MYSKSKENQLDKFGLFISSIIHTLDLTASRQFMIY